MNEAQQLIIDRLDEISEELRNLQDSEADSDTSDQPENQLKVFGSDKKTAGCPEIAQLINLVKSNGRIGTGEVQKVLDRSKTRCLRIMRKLDDHPDLKFKKRTMGKNRGAYLYED